MTPYGEALKILSRRRRSAHELKLKLKEKGFSPEEISEAVKKCIERGFLNDADYIADFINGQKNKGVGPYLIRMKLKMKFNLSEEKIPPIEASLDIALKKPKYQRLLKTREGKQKLIASLMRKGFNLDEIRASLLFMK